MFGKALDAINNILGIIPPLLWALALAVAGAAVLWVSHDLDATAKELKTTQAQFASLSGKVEQQKTDAAAQLARLISERDALQAVMDKQVTAQKEKDAKNEKIIASQNARLRSMSRDAGGGGLRDPNATGCGRGGAGPQGDAAAGAGGGAGDAPQAGGLLSIELERLLLRLEGEADAINRAYAACRPDAMTVRGLPPLPDPIPAVPAGDTAAPAAP